ncbi:MAG: hypothetical protein H6713_22880 [Myxococcales bacterium]|nr:hypothetical protein [Myxococcales bacterium]MCB9752809.1 hypothetical protein [Myxococcales bacterium]
MAYVNGVAHGTPRGDALLATTKGQLMSYFRHRYTSFEEFQREAFHHTHLHHELGKDELELLETMEEEDLFDRLPSRHRRSRWD